MIDVDNAGFFRKNMIQIRIPNTGMKQHITNNDSVNNDNDNATSFFVLSEYWSYNDDLTDVNPCF
jgi:hypothetical protein